MSPGASLNMTGGSGVKHTEVPVSHTTVQKLLLFRTGCQSLPVIGWRQGFSHADRACVLCAGCPGHKLLELEYATWQMRC